MKTKKLPMPTTDLRQCVVDLESSGYCYLADALRTAEVLQLQQRLSEQAQAEEQHGVAYKDGRQTRIGVIFETNKVNSVLLLLTLLLEVLTNVSGCW